MPERETYIPPETEAPGDVQQSPQKSEVEKEKPLQPPSNKKRSVTAGAALAATLMSGVGGMQAGKYVEKELNKGAVQMGIEQSEELTDTQRDALYNLREVLKGTHEGAGHSPEEEGKIIQWMLTAEMTDDEYATRTLVELAQYPNYAIAKPAFESLMRHDEFLRVQHIKKAVNEEQQPSVAPYDKEVTYGLIQLLDTNFRDEAAKELVKRGKEGRDEVEKYRQLQLAKAAEVENILAQTE